MSADWYVARDGATFGPYAWDRLPEMVAAGQIVAGDLVIGPGYKAWTPAEQVAELGLSIPPAPSPPPAAPRSGLGVRGCFVLATGAALLLAAGIVGLSLWWLWRSRPGTGPGVEYVEQRYETKPVVAPQASPESSGPRDLERSTDEVRLSDGTALSVRGLAPGSRLRVTLERRANDEAIGLEGLEATGALRVVTVDDVRVGAGTLGFHRPAARIVLPAREAGVLDPQTVQVARQGWRRVGGRLVERVDVLPVVRDGQGNLVARDPWFLDGLHGAPAAAAAADVVPSRWRSGTPTAKTLLALAAGPPSAGPTARNAIRYFAVTFQQSINWNRMPHLVRMVPRPGDPARRVPVHKLSPWDQEQELAKPVQNVFVLVHGRNEMEKSGLGTPAQIGEPWWYAYKRDVWTHFYEVYARDHPKRLGSTVFFEFVYPTFRPIFQGDGPNAELLDQALRKSLEKQLQPGYPFNLFLVAHSMGGVVSRAAAQHFEGGLADSFRHLATWGTPHLGSPLVSLNYLLISPYHSLDVSDWQVGSDAREWLLGSVLITDNPGTMDLRWTNGGPGHLSELRFDSLGFGYDWEAIDRAFPSREAAARVVDLRRGSQFYNQNLRLLNGRDRHAGSEKYVFMYGVTAKGIDLDWNRDVVETGFDAARLRGQGEIGLGATTLWVLTDDPSQTYRGVPRGHGDGAVPILSMSGLDLAGTTVALGDCDHEEYFGAPDSPGRFTVPGKARATARATLSALGVGSVKRYDPPLIRLKLERDGDVAALLKSQLDGDLEIEAELEWPGDDRPERRVDVARVEAFARKPGASERTPVFARDLAPRGGSRFLLGVSPRDLRRAGLGRTSDVELLVRLFFRDQTRLESEPLVLTGQELLSGSFLGKFRATAVNREFLLRRGLRDGDDEHTRMMNDIARARNRTRLQSLEWAGLGKENGLTLSILSVAENSGEPENLEGRFFVDVIFRGPRLIPNSFRPYRDKREGEIRLELTPRSFKATKKQVIDDGGLKATFVYAIEGQLRGETLAGTWSVTEDGTRTFAGTFTADRMGGVDDE